jgi:hypothetical protein
MLPRSVRPGLNWADPRLLWHGPDLSQVTAAPSTHMLGPTLESAQLPHGNGNPERPGPAMASTEQREGRASHKPCWTIRSRVPGPPVLPRPDNQRPLRMQVRVMARRGTSARARP